MTEMHFRRGFYYGILGSFEHPEQCLQLMEMLKHFVPLKYMAEAALPQFPSYWRQSHNKGVSPYQ